MQYKNFETSGIHTRLNVIIKKSDGYNIIASANCLMKEYKFDNLNIALEMAKSENTIRDEIEAIGIDNVIELTKKSMEIRRTNHRKNMKALDYMWNKLDCGKWAKLMRQ